MKTQLSKPDYMFPIATPEGEFTARYTEAGLAELRFPLKSARNTGLRGSGEASVPAKIRKWHSLTAKAVNAVLKGKTPSELPPLDFSKGTVFQQSVWKALASMPCGSTTSYGRLAAKVGRPAAVRAVGRACGANPIPVLVPCHRVLTASSDLGGFSGGLDWKRKLLRVEGVAVQ